MKISKTCFLIIILSLFPCILFSDGMQVMGSLQSIYMQRENSLHITNNYWNEEINETSSNSTFAVQQLDLILSNEFDYNIKTFVDLTFNWNYDSNKGWGEFNIQEAWAQYSYSDALNIQFGQLIPRFNYNNELRNKLPLLPYIIRPVYYEKILNNIFNVEDLIPETAYFQVYGMLPLMSKIRLDYSFFAGNSEDSYIINSKDNNQYHLSENVNGIDTTGLKQKLIGGRIGVHTSSESIRFGVSVTHDYDNRRDTLLRMWPSPIGDLDRWRIGWDMNFTFSGFELDGEFIFVDYKVGDSNFEDNMMTFAPNIVNKKEYYILSYLTSVLYNINSKLFVYGRYNNIDNTVDNFKVKDISLGAGYRILPNCIAKIQYLNHNQSFKNSDEKRLLYNYNADMLVLALSVLF